MNQRKAWVYGLVLSLAASSASAVVRVVVKNGKKVIYNDGVGEPTASKPQVSGAWSAARVAAPTRFDELIQTAARDESLDPKLLKSVMLFESGFDPRAVSRKGARGLMQLMPETAKSHGVRNVHDPAQNVQAGARHLSYLMDIYGGDLERTLAAYNAGEAAVERYRGVPPYDETRDYVRNILAAYSGGADLKGGFGAAPARTFRSRTVVRPVQVTRDANDRVLLTTEKPPARRLSS